MLGSNVDVVRDSRIWPNVRISKGYKVSGVIKKFIQTCNERNSPLWSLRTVSDEEAFYFNTCENNNVFYTGMKARSLMEFNDKLKEINLNCIAHHMRHGANDFSDWLSKIICDMHLAQEFYKAKKNVGTGDYHTLRQTLINKTETRLEDLFRVINKA